MSNRKTIWTLVLAVLLVVLSAGFIFDWGRKKAVDQNETETASMALQAEKLASQGEKIDELNRKIDQQSKLLAAQDGKLSEFANIVEELKEIQAVSKTNRVDINDLDMSQILQFIENQVKLNVAKAQMPAAGVVSIRKVFRDCKRTAKYRQDSNAERQQIEAELVRLDGEIKAQRAALKTLTIGSEGYLAQTREILEKQASLQAQQEFYKQQLSLKEQKLTEEIYTDILKITAEIAKEKGLVWVFEKSDPEIPTSSPTELELSMGMHKLLYDGGCIDITDEIISRLDSQQQS